MTDNDVFRLCGWPRPISEIFLATLKVTSLWLVIYVSEAWSVLLNEFQIYWKDKDTDMIPNHGANWFSGNPRLH